MTFRGKKASSTKGGNRDSERRESADKNVSFSQTISQKEISRLKGSAANIRKS